MSQCMNPEGVSKVSSSKTTYRGELLQVLVRGSKRGQPDLLGELCEGWICQQRHVPEYLVAAVPEIIVRFQRHPDPLG